MTQHQPTAFISIHAPARGATRMQRNLSEAYQFQSTLPRGERPIRPFLRFLPAVFQSTLPRGERLTGRSDNSSPADFNPRSREGSDETRPKHHLTNRHFNPRSREGSDVRRAYAIRFDQVFQSTLPRGERPIT